MIPLTPLHPIASLPHSPLNHQHPPSLPPSCLKWIHRSCHDGPISAAESLSTSVFWAGLLRRGAARCGVAQSSRTRIYLFGWVSFPEQRICRYLHILLQRRSTCSLARKGPAVIRCALWICLPPERGCSAAGPLKATRQPLQRNAGVFSRLHGQLARLARKTLALG